ncbi:MAG: type VII secretion protein EssC [Coriobacteriia bacterium]|nr:type VII secretion protein EssC [Coriobacteriia bacterium]
MQLILVDGDRIERLNLPAKPLGQYWVTRADESGGCDELLSVEGVAGQWVLKSNRRAAVLGQDEQPVKTMVLEPDVFYGIRITATGDSLLLLCESTTEDRQRFVRYQLPAHGSARIGRSESSEICFASRFVSNAHAALRFDDGHIAVEDRGSANGTFVNGRRVQAATLNPGDVIWIVGLTMVVGQSIIAINNPDGLVTVDERTLAPFELPDFNLMLDEDIEEAAVAQLFSRSPRFSERIRTAAFKLDPPPQRREEDTLPVMLVIGSALTMGVAASSIGIFTAFNVINQGRPFSDAIPALVMSASILLAMVMWPLLNRRYHTKQSALREQERLEKYRAYLSGIDARIESERARQADVLGRAVPTLADCLGWVMRRDGELWSRTADAHDFLSVRLGVGDASMDMELSAQEPKFSVEEDCLEAEMRAVADAARVMTGVPITVSLREHAILGLVGSAERTHSLLRGLVLQLAALHAHDVLRLVFIYDQDSHSDWASARWLPHTWSDDESIRLVASSAEELKGLSVHIEAQMRQREDERIPGRTGPLKPHYVVCVLNPALASRSHGLDRILREGAELGFSVVAAYQDRSELPDECTAIVDLGDSPTLMLAEQGEVSTLPFTPDVAVASWPRDAVETLANTRLDTTTDVRAFPAALPVLDMYRVGRVEHLNILTRWAGSNPVLSLEAPIGVDASGNIMKLDVHERFHGPHGLIAGMTGSGKSEFIMTYILSLALNYDPHEVAFVLIDYKGGGMANAFSELPHVVGTITNLDGAEVNRSLVSIQSELKRRQALFNAAADATGTSNIDIYAYQGLYREGEVSEPLSHLLIISDEFAELKAQQPEFMDQLVSAARIGRSLGVHLILATQKPSGVVNDQIWSNSRFRVCLKVQEKADSVEVIKRPDAAELSAAGRFYLQVGFNEVFEMGQSSWAGAPYVPNDTYTPDYDDSVALVSHLGQIVRRSRGEKSRGVLGPARRQLDEITAYIAGVAQSEGINIRPLWLDPIPGDVFVDELRRKYGQPARAGVLEPIIGEYDDPANQRQEVLAVPLSRDGNVVVYGSTGSGKERFIRTLMWSLIESSPPDLLNMYVIDCAAETLGAFRSAPHVGDVLFSHDHERIIRLMRMLGREMTRRKRLLVEANAGYSAYRTPSGERLASIVIVVHNYGGFADAHPDALEALTWIARDGIRYGLFVVLSATGSNDVRFQMLQNFKQMFALQFNDPVDYVSVLGKTGGMRPSTLEGRGLVRRDGVHEFQTARPRSGVDDDLAFIREECQRMADAWDGAAAPAVPAMPTIVTPEAIEAMLSDARFQGGIPCGVEVSTLEPAGLDFAGSFGTWVLSHDPEDAAFAQGMTELMGADMGNDVVVLDAAPAFVQDENRTYAYATGAALDPAVRELSSRIAERHVSVEAGTAATEFEAHPIVCVIVSYSRLAQSLSAEVRLLLEGMIARDGVPIGFRIVLVEAASEAQKLAYEAWTTHFKPTRGVWLGNGFADQSVLKVLSGRNDMYREIGSRNGYLISKGVPRLIKTLRSPLWAKDEEALDE